jgi:hypothetical protein
MKVNEAKKNLSRHRKNGWFSLDYGFAALKSRGMM